MEDLPVIKANFYYKYNSIKSLIDEFFDLREGARYEDFIVGLCEVLEM